jgi:hypothetical protein
VSTGSPTRSVINDTIWYDESGVEPNTLVLRSEDREIPNLGDPEQRRRSRERLKQELAS